MAWLSAAPWIDWQQWIGSAIPLARVYLHAWQVTGNPFYRKIVEETLDYVIREMTLPEGGFYSTQDADSEGEEGKFFVWTPDEICSVLGDQADHFIKVYGVTERGNFEGKNIPELKGSFEEREALAESILSQRRGRFLESSPDEDILGTFGFTFTALDT